MVIVALDTNALMMPVELDIRVFDELERLVGAVDAVVPQAVVRELDRLVNTGNATEVRAASVGRDLVRGRCRVVETPGDGGDASIVALAAGGCVDYVVTNDRSLRDRVLDMGVPVVGVRGRNVLGIVEP